MSEHLKQPTWVWPMSRDNDTSGAFTTMPNGAPELTFTRRDLDLAVLEARLHEAQFIDALLVNTPEDFDLWIKALSDRASELRAELQKQKAEKGKV